MNMRVNIFEIQSSKVDLDFIKKGIDCDLDVLSQIIDSSQDIPILGPILKLGKLGLNYIDFLFIKKLGTFLEQSENISEEVKQNFLDKLSSNDNKRISSYLLHLLYTSEEEEKAKIMGMIYKARLLNEIDNDIMLRLCSIVYKSFLSDLKKLPFYKEQNKEDSIEANNFINLGLIDNFVGGIWVDEPSWKLNDIGNQLYEILNQNKWFDENEK